MKIDKTVRKLLRFRENLRLFEHYRNDMTFRLSRSEINDERTIFEREIDRSERIIVYFIGQLLICCELWYR